MTDLSPEDRALVELSGRMSDEEIADAIGMTPAEVTRRREAAEASMQPAAEPERAAAGESAAPASGTPARRGVPVALALAALGAIVLVIIAASSGGSDDGGGKQAASTPKRSTGTQPATKPPKQQPAAASSKPVEMQRLNGTHGHGTAQISGGKLRLRLSDFLVPTGGGYAVWLLDPGEHRLLATTETTISRDVALPANWKRYKTLEVTRAVPSLDSPHTTFSLLSLPVSRLSGG